MHESTIQFINRFASKTEKVISCYCLIHRELTDDFPDMGNVNIRKTAGLNRRLKKEGRLLSTSPLRLLYLSGSRSQRAKRNLLGGGVCPECSPKKWCETHSGDFPKHFDKYCQKFGVVMTDFIHNNGQSVKRSECWFIRALGRDGVVAVRDR